MSEDETSSPSIQVASTTSKSIPALDAPFRQARDVTLPVVTERKIRPLDHAAGGELAEDDPLEETPSRKPEEPGTGLENADLRSTTSWSRAISRSGQTRGTGACSGRSKATGCGSNVIASAGTRRRIGLARSRPNRCW